MTIDPIGFVVVVVAAFVMGHGFTKRYYKIIVDAMTTKNQQLIERVKKAESIILHDLLQLSPDDIDLLSKNVKGDVTKSVPKE